MIWRASGREFAMSFFPGQLADEFAWHIPHISCNVYRPRSEGDNVLGSVRPSVRLSVRPSVRLSVRLSPLSWLNRLTYDLCLCLCNQSAYADNRADAVDRLLIMQCFENQQTAYQPSHCGPMWAAVLWVSPSPFSPLSGIISLTYLLPAICPINRVLLLFDYLA